MVLCTYCSGELGSRAPLNHEECVSEFRRRRDAGICVICGEADAMWSGGGCIKCAAAGRPPYRNYPGAA